MSLSPVFLINFFTPDDRKTVLKGQQAFDNGKVLSFEFKTDKILSHVQSSQKDQSYKVEIAIDDKQKVVLSSSCTCRIGLTKCAHMAAVLIYGTKTLSKTSVPVSWLQKPKSSKHKLRKIQTLDEILKPRHGKRLKLVEREEEQGPVHEVTEYAAGREKFAREMAALIPNFGLKLVLCKEPDISTIPLEKWKKLLVHKLLQEDQSVDEACDTLRQIALSPQQVQELAVDTTGQLSNILYCSIKKFRITSTKFHSVLLMAAEGECGKRKGRPTTAVKSREDKLTELLYPANQTLSHSAIEWGRVHEATARRSFTELTDLEVEEIGIFLDEETGCLGASPDGVVGDDAVLEIKCIFSLKDKSIQHWLEEHCNEAKSQKNVSHMAFLKAGSTMDSVVLNPNHAYFDQVQAQLHFSGRSQCFFFPWTPVKPHWILVVHKDPTYTAKVARLQEFYFGEFIPHLMKLCNSEREDTVTDTTEPITDDED